MGLAIELKRPQGSATKDQKKWKQDLEDKGYQAVIAKGREACLEIIRDYFKEDNLGFDYIAIQTINTYGN